MDADAPPPSQSKGTSPWVYIAIGCGVAVLLAVGTVAGLSFMGYRALRNVANDLKNPATREAKVKKVLGCETLPEGYKDGFSFSIPWVMDLAILSMI